MLCEKYVQGSVIRDLGLYSTRNTSKGALLKETAQLVNAISSGLPLNEIRAQAFEGILLQQRTRASRKRIWQILHYRLLTHRVNWIIDDLKRAYEMGSHSPEFISTIYLHYAFRDRLTFDFVTKIVWHRWCESSLAVSRTDLLSLLDQADETQVQIQRWSEISRRKLAGSILTALRDFGLLKGTQKKVITQPLLPLFTAEHLLRILTAEGVSGSDALNDSTWRLFLRSPDDIAHILMQLAQARRIRFERIGSTIILETPSEWRSSSSEWRSSL